MKLNLVLKWLLLLVVFSSVASMACGNGATGPTGGGGGGTGGEGGGQNPQYPVCMKFNAVFTGTLDGKTINTTAQTHLIGFDQGANPPTMDVSFDQAGDLILHWSGPMTYGKLTGVVGTLLLPGESSTKHNVLPGSTVISQDNFYYKFDLILDGGHLVACAYST